MQSEPSLPEILVMSAAKLEAIANRFVLSPLNISTASVKIMGIICRKGPLTPKNILELSGGTKSNLSQRLNFLEKEGHIKRTHAVSGGDMRTVTVSITAKGKSKMRMAHKMLQEPILSIEKDFSKTELRQFRMLLEKLSTNLDRRAAELERPSGNR